MLQSRLNPFAFEEKSMMTLPKSLLRLSIGRISMIFSIVLLMECHLEAQNSTNMNDILLQAEKAKVTGNLKILDEPKPVCIHYWNNLNDKISWECLISNPGNYLVKLNYSLDKGITGGVMSFIAGDQQIIAAAEPTLNWHDFRTFELGVVKLNKAGNVLVVLQGIQLPHTGGALPDVAWLSLTPTNVPATSKPLSAISALKNKPAKAFKVSASTVENGHPAELAFDGTTNTRWCASSDALNEWLCIDFNTPKTVGGMEIEWEFPNKEYGYTIEGSTDGKMWKELAKTRNTVAEKRTKLAGTYNSLRIKVTTLPDNKWASISEVRIFDNLGNAIEKYTSGNKVVVPTSQPGDFHGKPIFDGKIFDGWEGDLTWFYIANGAVIAGDLQKHIPRNEFLCTTSEFRDFELRVKVMLVNGKGNEGIQFRSQRVKDSREMMGYQADAADGCWGGLYDESRRGRFLSTRLNDAVLSTVLKRDD
jgi:hypothetical protein